jgi:phosphate acetyltransferase
MSSSIYVTAMEVASGKSVVALGIMEIASRRVDRLGFFRPVVPDDEVPDHLIDLFRQHYQLPQEYEDSYGVLLSQAVSVSTESEVAAMHQQILARYQALKAQCDFVVVLGSDFSGASAPLEYQFNCRVAANIGSPMILVVSGAGRSADDIADAVSLGEQTAEVNRAAIIASIVNRVAPDLMGKVAEALVEVTPQTPSYLLPDEPSLLNPTVTEVLEHTGARLITGGGTGMTREIRHVRVAAMSLPHFLDYLMPDTLVITPGDRADIIVGTVAARLSSNYPSAAALLLTGGLQVDLSVQRMLDGLPEGNIPVMSLDEDTYRSASKVDDILTVITAQDERKIALALGIFEGNIDTGDLEERIRVARSTTVTPQMFEHELIERAKSDRRHIVLPEGSDDRILIAAEQLLRRQVADLTILGNVEEVRVQAEALGVDIGKARVIDPTTSELLDEFAETYFQARKHKGVTEERARDTMTDVSYFGTMMVHKGLVDGMVSGAANTTAHTIRPSLEFVKTRPGVSIVSSVFLMALPDRVLVYGDCAVNPNPNARQLADIAISSAETAAAFGVEPRVAMLSYSTGSSGSGADVEKVREATEIARGKNPDLPIEGPIQYDAAVDAAVAASKLPGSSVAGQATVFVFPDLNTGNNTYKAVQRSAGALAIGPVLQGLNKPVNDLSRGCLIPDIVNTVAITAIQAQATGE